MSGKLDIWKTNKHEHEGRQSGMRMFGAMQELRSSEAARISMKKLMKQRVLELTEIV